jgi:hypothetical protein
MTDPKDIASRITALAEDALRPLDRTIAAWPAEFGSIIWGAVAEIALRREAALKIAHGKQE